MSKSDPDNNQASRFIDAAEKLNSDLSKERFRAILSAIALPKNAKENPKDDEA